MGIEVALIVTGIAILVYVLARRSLLEKRLAENRELLSKIKFDGVFTGEIEKLLSKAPLLKGDGRFAYAAVGCIPFANNFDAVRVSRRIYFVEPTIVDVLLIPDSENIERKLAVAVTVDSRILGYVPTNEAVEMHKFALARSMGLRAKAKIFIGSRPEYNGIMLDLAKPLRIESKSR